MEPAAFLQDEDANTYPDAERRASQQRLSKAVNAYELAQYGCIKTG